MATLAARKKDPLACRAKTSQASSPNLNRRVPNTGDRSTTGGAQVGFIVYVINIVRARVVLPLTSPAFEALVGVSSSVARLLSLSSNLAGVAGRAAGVPNRNGKAGKICCILACRLRLARLPGRLIGPSSRFGSALGFDKPGGIVGVARRDSLICCSNPGGIGGVP
nr:hypothetical protein CFP56_32195 [Quercus suber]